MKLFIMIFFMKSMLWMMKVPVSHLNNKLSNKYFTSVSRARAHSKVVINRSLKVEGFLCVLSKSKKVLLLRKGVQIVFKEIKMKGV